jgi:hypothetical protein
MNNPGSEISSVDNAKIKQIAVETAGRVERVILTAAEDVIRSGFKVRKHLKDIIICVTNLMKILFGNLYFGIIMTIMKSIN